jgi:4-hydroxythreonine-4-phosphate dehydrogenase
MASAHKVTLVAGDPAGIGPELTIRLLGAERLPAAGVTLVSDAGMLHAAGKALAGVSPEMERTVARFRGRLGREVGFVQTASRADVRVRGAWSDRNRDFVIEALKTGVRRCVSGRERLVTGPSDKRAFLGLGLKAAGHTEFLQAEVGGDEPLMLFDAGRLRVAILTRHIPLSEVSGHVTFARLRRSAMLARAYVDRVEEAGWEQERPIVVAALDPHCGEWGAISRMDLGVAGWVRRLGSRGVPVTGPVSGDALFARARLEHAAVLSWYHDQGMIPIKMAAFGKAVNVTLGLSVERYSPAHGVAYDIAWKGAAEAGSFRRALLLASK